MPCTIVHRPVLNIRFTPFLARMPIVTLMQKAITPALTRAHLTAGHDRLAGYVVRAEDVAFATTPAQLFEVHGLGYEGSPFSPYDRSIDVLRFESSPQLQYRDVPGYILPLWWLRHSRIPPGAELIRIYDNGTSTLLARYGDVGAGWTVTQLGAPRPSLASLSRCVGPVAKWHGAYLEADVVDSGHTVVLALANPPLAETGFHVLRFSWRHLMNPDDLLQRVHRVLALRAPPLDRRKVGT